MSILIAFANAGRAVVAVDSDVLEPSGRRHRVSKMRVIPLQRIVLAMRGNLNVMDVVTLAATGQGYTFDQVYEPAMAHFEQRIEKLEREGLQMGIPEQFRPGHNQELVIAGWSDRLDRFAVALYRNPEGVCSHQIVEEGVVVCAPGNMPSGIPSSLRNDDEIKALAAQQVAFLREKHPTLAAGGPLVIAEIRDRAVEIRDCGLLEVVGD